MKKFLSALIVSTLMFSATACSSQSAKNTGQEKTTTAQAVESSKEQTTEAATEQKSQEGVVKFTDSAGREVELPANIEKIAPSGYLAQIMLYSIAPDKMVGWGSQPKGDQMKYIDAKYADKPEFGAFYGKNANLNMEALMSAGPQVVIDLGEPKDDIKEGMDTIQTQTNIPAIFIDATFDKLPEAYTTLGKVLGEEEQGKKLSVYCKEALDVAKSNAEKVTTKPKVYYAEGENGLSTMGSGSIHSETIEYMGAENVAKLEKGSKSGAQISMEQLMNWDPDVIITADSKVYELITTDSSWANLRAVKDNKVYEVPSLPYNWVGRPPLVNRILGMQWLGTILFPDTFKYDMVKQAQEFYKLFYHYDLSEDEAKDMLKNSILKQQ